jgi:hypothetical protein
MGIRYWMSKGLVLWFGVRLELQQTAASKINFATLSSKPQAPPPPAPPSFRNTTFNTQHPNSLPTMPLDTSTYSLALLRLDGRRWNELRRLTAQISTQASADGSSYLEMGNTKVICTVTGPAEAKGAGGNRAGGDKADVRVEISIAGFSGVERKRRGRNDK